jgi:hypothetical protein
MNNEMVIESLENKILVSAPHELYDAIKRRIELSKGEFLSVKEYIVFILTDVIKEDEESKPVYSPEEKEEIKKKLRDLGYL